jgi:Protein of unknown function (DUF3606)
MADDLKNPGAQDRNRVNVNEDHEVRYWTQKWGVTKEQLMAAVKKAGASVAAVAKTLGKKWPSRSMFSIGAPGELMRDTETGWQSVRHKPNLASGGHDTDTAVQEFLDRTGTSPENMALRALLEKLDAKL